MSRISAKEKKALNQALKDASESAEHHYWHRLYCVQLVAQGCSAGGVAQWFNNDPSSVNRWVRHFKRFGVEGLRDEQIPGRPPKIGVEQRISLAQDLRQPPCYFGDSRHLDWTGQALAVHLEQKYDLKQSVRQCQRLLRQLAPQAAAISSEAGTAAEARRH